MPGDYSRYPHKPFNRYAGVLMQQGRVQLDSDWNELVALARRRDQLQAKDTFGPAAVPFATTPDAFKIKLVDGNFDLVISPGRFYVDGLLAELFDDETVYYSQQPFLPDPPGMDAEGAHLVYLDVWEREVTAIADPELLEKALGGPDTTTRLQTVWQIKYTSKGVGGAPVTCGVNLDALFPPSAARLTTRAYQPTAVATPCSLTDSGGYTGVDNRLYRVQIHQGGTADQARFKWSRENASVVSQVLRLDTADVSEIAVDGIGKDDSLRFAVGDWVEILDDQHELSESPGAMARVVKIRASECVLVLDRKLPPEFQPGSPSLHTRVVRWDQRQGVDSDGLLPVGVRVNLEDGVQLDFSLDQTVTNGQFNAGDYWCFIARTSDASVEPLREARPQGIVHHYAALGIVDPTVSPRTVGDCRKLWPTASTAPVAADQPTPGEYRCYQVDCDNGDDAGAVVGVGNTAAKAVAAGGVHRFKTLAAVAQRLPRLGNDSIAMVLVGRGTGAGVGDYTNDAFVIRSIVGYRKILIRGSDYSNSAADKASCGARRLATGTIRSGTDRTGIYAMHLDVTLAPTNGVPMGAAWRGARLTFMADTPTPSLRGKTLMIDQIDPNGQVDANGANTRTNHDIFSCEAVVAALGLDPPVGERFIIEGQSVKCSLLQIRGAAGQPNGSLSLAGMNLGTLVLSGVLGLETAFSSFGNLVADDLLKLSADGVYSDEDDVSAGVGTSIATAGLAVQHVDQIYFNRALFTGYSGTVQNYGLFEMKSCTATVMIYTGTGRLKVTGGSYLGLLFTDTIQAEFNGTTGLMPTDGTPWLQVNGSGSRIQISDLHGGRGTSGQVVILRDVYDTDVVFRGKNDISAPIAITMTDGISYDFRSIQWGDARDDRNNHAQFEGHCIANAGLLLDVAVNASESYPQYAIVRLNQENNKTTLRLAGASSPDVIGIVQGTISSATATNVKVRVATSGLSVVLLAQSTLLPGTILTLSPAAGVANSGGAVRLGVLIAVLDSNHGIVKLG
jgi:hypothetical protein